MIRVYDEAGNVIETHEHAGDFREHRNNPPLPNSAHAKANVHTNAAKVGVAERADVKLSMVAADLSWSRVTSVARLMK